MGALRVIERGHVIVENGRIAAVGAGPAVTRAVSARSWISSLSLSEKSNTQTIAAPPGETCGSARCPRKARLRRDPFGVTTMRNGAAVFWVRRTASVSSTSCSVLSPLSLPPEGPPSSSLRNCGIAPRPSQPASLPGASMRPSTRTNSGSAGDSSSIRASRKASRLSPANRRSRSRAQTITQTAASVQPASSRPINTSAV